MKLDIVIWALTLLFAAFFLTLPTGAAAQTAFAGIMVGFLLLTGKASSTPYFRQLFLIVCLSVIIRYVYWRVTTTLPSPADVLDFVPALVILFAEFYCIVMLLLSVFVMLDPLPSRKTPTLPAELPRVDIFVPSYNEDPGLVACTLAAAKGLDYDPERLTVYLLDDGGTDEKCNSDDPDLAERAIERRATLAALCDNLGVRYIARPANIMAKAGNLNYGLDHSTGDLVVVFDADHVPLKSFLTETVGHFAEDERLFLVQTPHVFLNPDPIERNLGFAGTMPSENEMFYGSVQRGLDSWNASYFCGSAAVLRRAALDEVGGFAGVSITEDCETALALHARGWNSRYVDKPLVRGLQPETFAAFIGQRSRWCRGMIQIFLLKSPWLTPNLRIAQRLCYTSSSMFWFFPLVRWVFMLAPLMYIFFGLKVYNASLNSFWLYTVPYLAAATLMQGFLFRKYRWPWVSELYEYVQSVYLARAVFSVILNPRKPIFKVTDKGVTLQSSTLSPLAAPYYVMFFVFAAAMAFTIYRYHTEPARHSLLVLMGAWNLTNLILAGLALGCVSERRELRGAPRLAATRSMVLRTPDGEWKARLEDISHGGVRLRMARSQQGRFPLGSRATLVVPIKAQHETIEIDLLVRNRITDGDLRLGAAFAEDDDRRFALIAALMYARADRNLGQEEGRRARNGLVWTGEFLLRAVKQCLRGLVYGAFRRGRRVRRAATPAAAER